jgi:hypothetical protein
MKSGEGTCSIGSLGGTRRAKDHVSEVVSCGGLIAAPEVKQEQLWESKLNGLRSALDVPVNFIFSLLGVMCAMFSLFNAYCSLDLLFYCN